MKTRHVLHDKTHYEVQYDSVTFVKLKPPRTKIADPPFSVQQYTRNTSGGRRARLVQQRKQVLRQGTDTSILPPSPPSPPPLLLSVYLLSSSYLHFLQFPSASECCRFFDFDMSILRPQHSSTRVATDQFLFDSSQMKHTPGKIVLVSHPDTNEYPAPGQTATTPSEG